MYAGSVVVDDGDAGCVDAAVVVVDGVGVGCIVVDAGFDVGLVVVVDGTKNLDSKQVCYDAGWKSHCTMISWHINSTVSCNGGKLRLRI